MVLTASLCDALYLQILSKVNNACAYAVMFAPDYAEDLSVLI